MKKFIAILLCLCLCFACVACGNDQIPEISTTVPSMNTNTPENTHTNKYQLNTAPLTCTAEVLHFVDNDENHPLNYCADYIRITFNCTYLELLLRDENIVRQMNTIEQTCKIADIEFDINQCLRVSYSTVNEDKNFSTMDKQHERPYPNLNDTAVIDIMLSQGTNTCDNTYQPESVLNAAKYKLASGTETLMQYYIQTPDQQGGSNGYISIQLNMDIVTTIFENMNPTYGNLIM